MTFRKLLLWVLFVSFFIFSMWAMWDVGYLGIWQAGMASSGSWQILMDLVIACLLISSWIKGDAEHRGINPWPWIIATLFAGTLAPLMYLLVREYQRSPMLKPSQSAT